MAGRPRTTLKRLTELLRSAELLGTELFELIPSQYEERPSYDDPLCDAWQQAKDSVVMNYRALETLKEQVAAKVAKADQKKNLNGLKSDTERQFGR
jgi:hypothetical protein